MKTKEVEFLVIEDSGVGHHLCNSRVTVKAENALQAAIKATQCPVGMVVEEDPNENGVWTAIDEISNRGWSGVTDKAHIKLMEEMVDKKHMRRRVYDGKVIYNPISQWIVTVIRRYGKR